MGRQVWVKGHYRRDGTYVPGHYRTSPDGNCQNNYGYPGNYNPNTMEFTEGGPLEYLEQCRRKKRPTFAIQPFRQQITRFK